MAAARPAPEPAVPAAEARPVFPLGTVLLPHAPLSLHVFEDRYRALVRDLRAGTGEFGVVLIERGREVGGGEVRYRSGTIARLESVAALPDGRSLVTARGTDPFDVLEWLPDDPYPRAMIVRREEPPPTVEVAEARDRVEVALGRLLEEWARHDERARAVDLRVPGDPVLASWDVAARLPIGPLDAQRILDAAGAEARLGLVEAAIDDLHAVLRAQGPQPD